MKTYKVPKGKKQPFETIPPSAKESTRSSIEAFTPRKANTKKSN